MRRKYFFVLLIVIFYQSNISPQVNNPAADTLAEFKIMLSGLAEMSTEPLFKLHCTSIIDVIDAELILSDKDISYINQMYLAFNGVNTSWNAGELSTYKQRRRPFIISWISPTDKLISLAWFLPPENWDREKEYPLYVSLHGAWEPFEAPLEYMALPLIPQNYLNQSFEDGYLALPWARGNSWYESIGEVDVWECIDVIENLVKIDQRKKYLVGHSMGGYGAWAIAQANPEAWAAIGIYAGGLQYKSYQYLNIETAVKLANLPVYIVCGEQDDFINMNYQAYVMLRDVGNTNIAFVSYPGDHTALYVQWDAMHKWISQYSRDIQTDVKSSEGLVPSRLILNSNYPNPFNPETIISYELPSSSFVELKVFDALGREVKTLVSKEQIAGSYEVKFNAETLSGGVYLYRLTTGNSSVTRKMIVLK